MCQGNQLDNSLIWVSASLRSKWVVFIGFSADHLIVGEGRNLNGLLEETVK